jgi:hypothetical protein
MPQILTLGLFDSNETENCCVILSAIDNYACRCNLITVCIIRRGGFSANASVVSRDEPCDTCTEESESVLSGARRGEIYSATFPCKFNSFRTNPEPRSLLDF